MNCQEEAAEIKKVLQAGLSAQWDGKKSIVEMRDANARHWRQMEWIGWYFQWKAFQLLTSAIGGGAGPRYSTSDFDYSRDCVWDFKAHVSNAGKPWAILNDANAIEGCIAEHGSVGFIIAAGPAFYNDVQQTFKTWHNSIMEKQSKYVLQGIASGRSSRRRKTLFVLGDILLFRLDAETLARGRTEGWIKGFQLGMVNSNGKPRPSKVQVHLGKMPPFLFL